MGYPALIWLHPDPLSFDSLVLSHNLDIKAPPGRHMSVLGVQASPETSYPLRRRLRRRRRTSLHFQMQKDISFVA